MCFSYSASLIIDVSVNVSYKLILFNNVFFVLVFLNVMTQIMSVYGMFWTEPVGAGADDTDRFWDAAPPPPPPPPPEDKD